MEHFFEDDPPFSPLKKQLTVSTPCTKGKTPVFPSNVTPVAVKQLFTQSDGRHLSEFTWSSSLATGFQSEESDVDGNQDMSSNDVDGKKGLSATAGDASRSLFSSWMEEGLTAISEDTREPTVTSGISGDDVTLVDNSKTDDSLSHLLRTPPSLMSKRPIIPRKRASADSSDNILDGIINQPRLKKRKRSASGQISPRSLLVNSPPNSTDPKSGTDLDFDTTAKTSAASSSLRKSHNSAFKHSSKSGGSKTPVSAQQYKPVRPLGVSKRNFYYPSTPGVSDATDHSLINSVCEKSPPLVKPRKLSKFTAPLRAEEDGHTGNNGLVVPTGGQTSLISTDSGFTSPTLRLDTPSNVSTPSTRGCTVEDANQTSVEHATELSTNSDMNTVAELPMASEDKSGLDDSILWESQLIAEGELSRKNATSPSGNHQVALAVRVPDASVSFTPNKELPKNSLVASILDRFCVQPSCTELFSSPSQLTNDGTSNEADNYRTDPKTPSISSLLSLMKKNPSVGNRQNNLHVTFGVEPICSRKAADAKIIGNSSSTQDYGTAEADIMYYENGSMDETCSVSNMLSEKSKSLSKIISEEKEESGNGFEIVASDDANERSMDESRLQMIAGSRLSTANGVEKLGQCISKPNECKAEDVPSMKLPSKAGLDDVKTCNDNANQCSAFSCQGIQSATADGKTNMSDSDATSVDEVYNNVDTSAIMKRNDISTPSNSFSLGSKNADSELKLSNDRINLCPSRSESPSKGVCNPNNTLMYSSRVSDTKFRYQSSGCDNVAPNSLLPRSADTLVVAEFIGLMSTKDIAENDKPLLKDFIAEQEMSSANNHGKLHGFAITEEKAITVSDSSLPSVENPLTDAHTKTGALDCYQKPTFKHVAGERSNSDLMKSRWDSPSNAQKSAAKVNPVDGETIKVSGDGHEKARNISDETEAVEVSNYKSSPSFQLPTTERERFSAGLCTSGVRKTPVFSSSFQSIRGLSQSDCSSGNPGINTMKVLTAGFNNASEENIICTRSGFQPVKDIHDKDNATHENLSKPSGFSSSSARFSTAAGKKIEVLNSSLQAVRGLLESDHSIPHENRNDNVQAVGFGTSFRKKMTCLEPAIKMIKGNSEQDAPLKLSSSVASGPLSRISTAADNEIEVSNSSPQAVLGPNASDHSILHAGNRSKKMQTAGFSAASGKTIACSESALKAVKGIFKNNALLEPLSPVTSSLSAGFCTAAGKEIQVSNSSLHVVQKIFESDHPVSHSERGNKEAHAVRFSKASRETIACSESTLKAVKGVFEDNTSLEPYASAASSSFAGFSTAAGKKVQVSNSSLQAIQNMFESDHPVSHPESGDKKAETVGFSTASGKKIACSEYAMKSVKGIFEDSTLLEPSSSVASNSSVGFCTAAGNEIQVSNSSLNAVQKIFESDHPVSHPESGNKEAHTARFSKASGETVACSESTLKAVKGVFEDNASLEPYASAASSSFAGFSTAAGKEAQVCKSSLQVVQKMFESSHPVSHPESEDKKAQTAGFSTASGKKIACSESALKAVKGIFEDNTSLEPYASVASSSFAGFSTAAGNEIQVSNSSLHAVQNMFESGHPVSHSESGDKKAPTVGFSKASGKNVACSASALKAVKGMFDEDNALLKSSQRFCSATRKEIQVPNSSLQMAQGISEPGHSTPNPKIVSNKGQTVGFSTASGKKVNCSESALQAVRGIFHEDNGSCKSIASAGFCTAAGQPVEISISSLEAAKHILQDSDLPVTSSVFAASTKNSNEANCSGDGNGAEVCQNLLKLNGLQDELNSYVIGTHVFEVLKSEKDSIQLCRRVPEGCPTSAVEPLNTCSTPPVTRRLSVFKERSPLWVSPNGLARNRSLNSKPYWTTPNNSAKKFSFGNKPFKAHTPDRDALAKKLQEEKTTSAKRSLQPAAVGCENQTVAEPFPSKEILTYSVDDKPDNLKKPTQLMTSAKKQRGRTTLYALRPPSTESSNDVEPTTASMSSAAAAAHSFNKVSKRMADDIRSMCVSSIVEGHLISPVTADNLFACFQLMPGVDPSLISRDWFNNHYRWIVWKLACLERSYYHMYADVCNPLEVLRQMKYRYEREVDLCQRSALKKIYEGDDVAGKPLVLLVSKVGLRPVDDSTPQNGYELRLSDGWYDIAATYDSELNTLIGRGKIKEGVKLLIVGGQLSGLHQCCPPLSAQAKDVQLKICTNSVRRARFDVRLGYTSARFSVPFRSLLPLGGAVPCLQILIATVYPIVYMEKTPTGTVFRNELREQQEQRADAAKRDKLMEQELNKENLTDLEAATQRTRRYTEADVRSAYTGLELFNLVQTSVDPHTVQAMMTDRQQERLFSYQQSKVQQRTSTIQSKVKARLPPERCVVPMLKVRVISTHESDRATNAWTMLTLWRPTHDMLTLLKEGCVYNAHNLAVSALRGQRVNAPVLLSANKRSMFEKISLSEELVSDLFQARQIHPLKNIYNVITRTSTIELDTAGIVIGWESPKDSLTVVYISDCDGHMLALTVWGGLKAQGYTDRVKEGQLLYCSNLQKSSSITRYGLPNIAVTELSIISSSCQQKLSNDYTKELSALKLDECKKLVKQCQRRLLELARQREHNSRAQPSSYQVRSTLKRSLHQPCEDIPSAGEVPLGSRRALGRQFRNPVVTHRSVPAPMQATTAEKQAAGADEHDEEVSDSQLLDCISQS